MPIEYLFDTNAVSDAMAEHPQMQMRIPSQAGILKTSVVVRGEIRFGLERLPAGKRRRDLEWKAGAVLGALLHEPVSEPIADLYGSVRSTIEAQGLKLDDNDLWLAATAMHTGAVLVTRDKDFAKVSGLSVEDWTR